MTEQTLKLRINGKEYEALVGIEQVFEQDLGTSYAAEPIHAIEVLNLTDANGEDCNELRTPELDIDICNLV